MSINDLLAETTWHLLLKLRSNIASYVGNCDFLRAVQKKFLDVISHLLGQFSSRHEDQCSSSLSSFIGFGESLHTVKDNISLCSFDDKKFLFVVALAYLFQLKNILYDWQAVGGSFSTSCPSTGENVDTFEG